MKKMYLPSLLLALLISCNTADKKNDDEAYATFRNNKAKALASSNDAVIAREVANNHYNPAKREEAKQWIRKYEEDSTRNTNTLVKDSRADSLKLATIGAFSILEIDLGRSKCNLIKGSYLLAARGVDSAGIAYAVRHYASKLFDHGKSNKGCTNPRTSSAYIFASRTDFTDGNAPLASCTITSDDYSGAVYVDRDVLKAFNGHYRLKLKDTITLFNALKK